MRKALTGAALAAAMTCGCISEAAASILSFDFTIADGPGSTVTASGNPLPFNIPASGFSYSGSITLSLPEHKPGQGQGTLAVTALDLTLGTQHYDASDVTFTNFGDEGRTYSGSLLIAFGVNTNQILSFVTKDGVPYAGGVLLSAVPGYPGASFICGGPGCVSIQNVDGALPLSPVPLPGSVALFGSALLVLAGAGYAIGRNRTATQAA